jgi:hypothetical protein
MTTKTITISVDATSRVSRFEFSTPHLPSGMVYAYSEVLLQEPAEPSKGAEIMRPRTPMGGRDASGEPIVYGVMPGAHLSRGIPAVADETVSVDGKTVSFEMVLQAMNAFFEKWRAEDIASDAAKPTTGEVTTTPPPQPPE